MAVFIQFSLCFTISNPTLDDMKADETPSRDQGSKSRHPRLLPMRLCFLCSCIIFFSGEVMSANQCSGPILRKILIKPGARYRQKKTLEYAVFQVH